MLDKIYSRNELAKILGTDPATIYRWEKTGQSPVTPSKRSNMMIYTESDKQKIIDWRRSLNKLSADPVELQVLNKMKTDLGFRNEVIERMNRPASISAVDELFRRVK